MLASVCLCCNQRDKLKAPPQGNMRFLSLTSKRSRWMTSTTAGLLFVVCLQLSLSPAIECYNDYGQQQQVAAASSAASLASSGGGGGRSGNAYAFSAATAGANSQGERISQQLAIQKELKEARLRRQQQEDRLRRKAELKRARQAESMLAQLLDMEASGAKSLADCSRWDHLNVNYIELIGGTPGKATRKGELLMRQQCDGLYDEAKSINTRIDDFRRLALQERDHFEFVSNLVDQYVDLQRDSKLNEQLGRQLEQVKANDEQIRISVENLDAFIGFMRQKLALDEPLLAAASIAAPQSTLNRLDEIEELDRSIKSLVDREESLDDAELERLNELGDMLERILAGGHVDLQSGRFRYLTGTLDATRAVILHRLKGDDDVDVVGQADDLAEEQQAAEASSFAYADSSRRQDFEDVLKEQQQQQQQQKEDLEVRPPATPRRRANNYYSSDAVALASAGAGPAATGGRSLAAAGSSAGAYSPPSRLVLPFDNVSKPIRQQQVAMAGSQAFSGVPLQEEQQPQHQHRPGNTNANQAMASAAAFAVASNSNNNNNSQRQTHSGNIGIKQLDNNNNHSNKQESIQTGRPAAFASAAATASSVATSSAPSGSFGRWPALSLGQRRFADHPTQQTKRD